MAFAGTTRVRVDNDADIKDTEWCKGSKDPYLEEHFLHVYEDWEMPDPGDPDPENQEGFFWSCCSGNGLSQGCTIARHVPALPETKFMKPAKDLDRIVWRDGRQYD